MAAVADKLDNVSAIVYDRAKPEVNDLPERELIQDKSIRGRVKKYRQKRKFIIVSCLGKYQNSHRHTRLYKEIGRKGGGKLDVMD